MFVSIIIIYTHQCFFSFPTFRQVLHLIIYIIDKRTNPNAFHNVEQVHLVIETCFPIVPYLSIVNQYVKDRVLWVSFLKSGAKIQLIFDIAKYFCIFLIFFSDPTILCYQKPTEVGLIPVINCFSPTL